LEPARLRFIRYPGGKLRILGYILPYLPSRESIKGIFVEPFVGSGAVFFALNPKRALLADINEELIDLYRGIHHDPLKVWQIFEGFPATKEGYYQVRSLVFDKKELELRAARTLYLNRTCFKGMWRHNSNGEFNIGYGGQDRRWIITKEDLIEISNRVKRASLRCSDFEDIIDTCRAGDFIFVDPPYKPGKREMMHAHYLYNRFHYTDHQRLATTLQRATAKNVRWAITNSSHPDIVNLYRKNHIIPLPKGTGGSPGILTNKSGEVLIRNYEGGAS